MAMKRTKFTALLLSLIMAVSMASCGQEIKNSDPQAAKASVPNSDSSAVTPSGDTSDKEKVTTAATEATTTSATTTTKLDETGTADPAADYASIPESGYWTNNVVVCDQNKGSKIRGLLGFGADESSAKVFTTMVNNVKKMVGDKVNVYTLPAPVSSAYYTPKGMDGVTSDQHAATTALSKILDPSIKNIDAYSALAKHTNEYIYYRTDHHWTTLAAYYATKEFAKAADVPFTELDKMEKVTKTGFTGSMYTYSGCQEFLKYPDTYIYYKPKNQYTTTYYDCDFTNPVKSELFHEYAEGSNLYCTILGTDMTICEMKTDVKNGRTLVLIKDSYGNAMAPYFVGSFEKIYVIDMRYTTIKLKDFFEKVGATDILFGSSISSFYTISRAEYLNGIMK